MDKYEKVIEMLTSGVSREMAIEIIKQFCPKFFGLENDKKAINEYGCTRCDICWNSKDGAE